MKLKKRNTARRVTAESITSPETDPGENGVRIPLLSYIDARGNQEKLRTSKDLFLFAAGDNSEGQLPEGLDRLRDHTYIIHVDADDKAIGLDIIPSRVYRAQVIPASQLNVKNVRVEWMLDGAVCRVTSRPPGIKSDRLTALVNALNKLVSDGKKIDSSTRLEGIGRVVLVEGDAVEVKLNSAKTAVAAPSFDLGDS